jgi:hypothetical protein
MTTLEAIRHNLDALAAQAQTAGDALDGATVDLADGTLDQLLTELLTLSGRLDLVLDRLSAAVDPARTNPDPADLEAVVGRPD